jgi:putative peptidoglycan lipid II flippase
LNSTLRYLALVIPFSALIIVLRSEVVRLLFQRGRFDAGATAMTADVLIYFMIGAFAFAAYTVVVRGYFASQDTLFPAIYGSVAVVLSIPLYLAGMHFLGARGIALAVSLSGIFQVSFLYALWNHRSHNPESRGVYAFYLKILLLSAGIGVILEWFKVTALSGLEATTIFGNLLVCMLTCAVFGTLLLAAGYGLKIQEITTLVKRVIDKLKS